MRIAVIVLAAVLAGGCASQAPESTSPPGQASSSPAGSPAGPAPAASGGAVADTLKFTASTVDGNAFDGATLAGKPVVLWF